MNPERPKRLSLSEILELMLAKSPRDHSSVTISRNAKGEAQIEVVVRTGDTPELETAAQAADEAARLFSELIAKFPLSDGRVLAGPPAVEAAERKRAAAAAAIARSQS